MVTKPDGWNITNDSNMAHHPATSLTRHQGEPPYSIQQKCLHQDLLKPKDLGNHSEKQICETIPSDNSWKYPYRPYLRDSEPSKGSAVFLHISNISTCFCVSELFTCLQFTERSNIFLQFRWMLWFPYETPFRWYASIAKLLQRWRPIGQLSPLGRFCVRVALTGVQVHLSGSWDQTLLPPSQKNWDMQK